VYDPKDYIKPKKKKKSDPDIEFDPIDYGSNRFKFIGTFNLFNDEHQQVQKMKLMEIKLPG
jgi:hypothetical protein